MISEKCRNTYTKLNTFVTNVINRDVTPQITNLNETKLDNKDFITTSFTPTKLKTAIGKGTIEKNNVSLEPPGSSQPGFVTFRFECNTDEYYEFNIVVQDATPIDMYDGSNGYAYATLDTGTHTIKITKNQLIIDGTSITRTYTWIYLKFENNSSSMGRFYFSNKKWYHEATFFDKIYPIGSVHITTNSVNPSNYFDGEWERIQDTFLLASGTTYENGSTGGSATVTLTRDEMPSHTHIQNSHNHTQNAHTHKGASGRAFVTDVEGKGINESRFTVVSSGSTYTVRFASGDNWWGVPDVGNTTATNQAQTATNQNTGGGQAHENMPPYLAVYMWERVG